jgi:ubiquinone/menaquinone biosynthesis C-methylase UbiE
MVNQLSVVINTQAGAAVYSKTVLRLYDFWVHGLSNHYLWHCPTVQLHALYQQYTTNNHLEVGVGTGFFLKQVKFSRLKPRIVLMDLNTNTLEMVSQAIAHYQPAGVVNDILSPTQPQLPLFDSIAFNYVWHCLPANANKAQAFTHLAQFLKPDGVLFGATLLGKDTKLNPIAKGLMTLYNQKGIFGNQYDSYAALESALAANFSRYDIRQIGTAAIFSAWK